MTDLNTYLILDDLRIYELEARRKPINDETSDGDGKEQVTHEFRLSTRIADASSDGILFLAAKLEMKLAFTGGEIEVSSEARYHLAEEQADLAIERNFLAYLNSVGLIELLAVIRAAVAEIAATVFRSSLSIPSFSHLNLHFSPEDQQA